MSDFLAYASVTVLMIVGILLIFIVLLQRGRGGGLAGALGGAGGQSALGTKAGDVFTKITIVLAAIWILLACLSIYAVRNAAESKAEAFTNPDAGESESGSVTAGDDAGTEAADTAEAAGDSTEGPALGAPPESDAAPASEPADSNPQ